MASKEIGQPIPTLGQAQDVVMQDAFSTAMAGVAAHAAAAGAPGNKKFFPKKFGGVAKMKPIPAAIKKKRINFRLKKILAPKSPLMILNEMVGSVNYSFVDTPAPMMPPGPGMPHLFTAQCTVDGESFHGTGPSKQIAKNICAEHVIQFVVTKKCNENRAKTQMNLELSDPNQKPPMEDETPWLQLASLALFKLFNDWQAQGYVIPSELLKTEGEMKEKAKQEDVPMSTEGNPAPVKPKQAKKVPDNPTDRHPVQLLNELRGGVTFNVVGSSGVTPNIIFTMGCEIEGIEYSGVGRNKKDAKKHCAMEALKALYDIQYPGTLTAEQA